MSYIYLTLKKKQKYFRFLFAEKIKIRTFARKYLIKHSKDKVSNFGGGGCAMAHPPFFYWERFEDFRRFSAA